MTWTYLGRDFASGEILDVYRIPDDRSMPFGHRLSYIEHLTPNGEWVVDKSCTAAYLEYSSGWLTENDIISAAQVQTLVDHWNREGWPKYNG